MIAIMTSLDEIYDYVFLKTRSLKDGRSITCITCSLYNI